MNSTKQQRIAADTTRTAAPIAPGTVCDIQPEFIEVGQVPVLFGIRRTLLYHAMKSGAVRSVLLRRPGCQNGKRLVHAASVRDYLLSEMEKQGGFTPGRCNAHAKKVKG